MSDKGTWDTKHEAWCDGFDDGFWVAVIVMQMILSVLVALYGLWLLL